MTEPVKVIAQILAEELGLGEGYVMLTNQQNIIPRTGLYIAVGYSQPSNIIANVNRPRVNGDGLLEDQSISMRHMIQIDIMAQNDADGNNEARERKEEVAMALRSNRAQELSILNAMQIAKNPGPIIDTSDLEGAVNQSRFTMVVSVNAVHRKTKAAKHYDTFKGELHPGRKTEPYFDKFETKELTNG